MKDFNISLTTSPVPHKHPTVAVENIMNIVFNMLFLIAAGIVFWCGVVHI